VLAVVVVVSVVVPQNFVEDIHYRCSCDDTCALSSLPAGFVPLVGLSACSLSVELLCLTAYTDIGVFVPRAICAGL